MSRERADQAKDVGRETSHCASQIAPRGPGDPLGELAQRQSGVFSLDQARAGGLSASGVRSRVARGRWRRVHRGVYAFGHSALVPRGRLMAALLACGPGAVLSHWSAAWVWGLVRSWGAPIHVTVAGRRGCSVSGIRSHRSSLPDADRARYDGLPVTTVARTLLDLCEVGDDTRVARAVEEAEKLRRFDLGAVEDVLSRACGRHGSARLSRVLADYGREAVTRSELERAFVRLCEAAGLPAPAMNLTVAGLEVDAVWPGARLAVELDSRRHHHTTAAFQRDRDRDRTLTLAGWRPVRFTWFDVDARAPATAAELCRLLGAPCA